MEDRDVAARALADKAEVASEKENFNARGRTGAIILGFLVLLALVYAPALTEKYGWNDDYPLLIRVTNGSFDLFHNEYMEVGRPLLGFGTKLLFSIPNSLDAFREARIVSVVGVLIFALVTFVALRRVGFDRGFSFTVAMLSCLTPGFAVTQGG